jgi:hypothetical protein
LACAVGDNVHVIVLPLGEEVQFEISDPNFFFTSSSISVSFDASEASRVML